MNRAEFGNLIDWLREESVSLNLSEKEKDKEWKIYQSVLSKEEEKIEEREIFAKPSTCISVSSEPCTFKNMCPYCATNSEVV